MNAKHHLYLKLALEVAKEGTCPRAKVGAVLVHDSRPISIGYNGSPRGTEHCNKIGCWYLTKGKRKHCLRAVHAELNAILNAAYVGISTNGTTLYCTHKPCVDCLKTLINSGVRNVFYLNDYDDELADKLVNHRVFQLKVKLNGKPCV